MSKNICDLQGKIYSIDNFNYKNKKGEDKSGTNLIIEIENGSGEYQSISPVQLTAFGVNSDIIQRFEKGDSINLSCDISGRMYKDRNNNERIANQITVRKVLQKKEEGEGNKKEGLTELDKKPLEELKGF